MAKLGITRGAEAAMEHHVTSVPLCCGLAQFDAGEHEPFIVFSATGETFPGGIYDFFIRQPTSSTPSRGHERP
jgi:hypothetical protein